MNLEITGDADNGYRLRGMLTYETVPGMFRQASLDYGATTDLDVGGLDRVDSAGLALLVEWSCAARVQEKELILKNIPSSLRALINASGLQEILSISDL